MASDGSAFASKHTIGAIALLAAVALIGVAIYQQRKAADELAAADRARAEEIRAESRAQRDVDNDARNSQLDARVDSALAQLDSDRPMTQCQGASQLGRIGTQANITRLLDIVYDYSARSSVRICALSAVLELGDSATALGAYEMWAKDSDADLRRAAITGFGAVGPEATDTALPYLQRDLQSPFMDVRYLVVESLGQLGPAANPLLAQAARDQNELVRGRAAALLKTRNGRP